MRVVLFGWVGFWRPQGPDNDRACVFDSGDAALAWAETARDPYVPEHWRCLAVPTWPEPPPDVPHQLDNYLAAQFLELAAAHLRDGTEHAADEEIAIALDYRKRARESPE